MKKGLKIFLIIVGILVGLLLLISILAGPIVKYYAEKHSVELCHRVVTLEHVRINILTGTVTIVGLNAKEENAKDDFLSFHKLNVQLSLPRLLGKTVRINHIRLDQLNAQVIEAIDAVQKCRAYLDKKTDTEKEPIYGVTTGFGSLCNRSISKEDLSTLQRNLVISHACGVGNEVPQDIVQLMLLMKIQSLSYGHSGVQLATIQRLVDFYNKGVYPVVYQQGSL